MGLDQCLGVKVFTITTYLIEYLLWVGLWCTTTGSGQGEWPECPLALFSAECHLQSKM